MSLETWLAFAVASAIAVAIPGPVVVFVVTRAADGQLTLTEAGTPRVPLSLADAVGRLRDTHRARNPRESRPPPHPSR